MKFDWTIKLGDLLTTVTIIVSVVALLISWSKDRYSKRKEQADRVRAAVAIALAKLDRWQALQLSSFQEIEERLAVMDHKHVITGRNLSEEIQLVEHDLIKHALESNKRSITRSARALGISYQELSYMLKTRHAELLKLRTPPRRRPPKE